MLKRLIQQNFRQMEGYMNKKLVKGIQSTHLDTKTRINNFASETKIKQQLMLKQILAD